MDERFDTLIRGGLVFDGLGNEPQVADVGVRDGNVVAIAPDLRSEGAAEVIEAQGHWVTPGFIDLHTHYDAELEVTPEIFESVRHGVTTVVTGSCSLSMAVGDPVELADMFCRVEAIPRRVVKPLLEQRKDWDDPAGYLEHLQRQPLGPNVACMLGHSTIRAAAMGMARALDKNATPTEPEMVQMESWLEQSLDAGYIGLSISTLPWDKMDGDEFRSRPMPSVFARWKEYRRLAKQLRKRGRVLQAIPNVSTKINVLLFPLISAGLWWRNTLKTTLISMMDVRADRFAFRIAGWLCRLANRFLGADLRLQALPEPFDLWADGVDLVVFVEFEAGTAALHVQDLMKRADLLRSPEYRARFKKQWRRKFVPKAYHRDLASAEILECPDRSVVGRTFAEVAEERGVDPVDAFLDLAADHGPALRWYTMMGNDRPPVAALDRQPPRRADRLLGCGGPPSQHGPLQLPTADAEAGSRRRAAGRAVHDPATRRPAAHLRDRSMAGDRRRSPRGGQARRCRRGRSHPPHRSSSPPCTRRRCPASG